jgi:hypothetical protein
MTISPTTLKNAARAIEHDLWTDSDGANHLVKDGAILRRWEPETSSADSFDLMARLNIEVISFNGYEEVHALDYLGENTATAYYTDDRAQDYRNAILQCAASIGAAISSPENP